MRNCTTAGRSTEPLDSTTVTWANILAIVIVVAQLSISGYVLWDRNRRGLTKNQHHPFKYTRVGVVINAVAIVAMMWGIATNENAILKATTALGAWIQQHGLMTYLVLLYAATLLVAFALDRAGIRVWRKSSAV